MCCRISRFIDGRFRRRVWRFAGALGGRGVVTSEIMDFSRRRGRRRPPGRRVRPPELPGRCQLGGVDFSVVGSGDVFGGLRGRSVHVALSSRAPWNFLGDAGAADRLRVAFGLRSSPADVSTFRLRRCLPAGAGSRWVAAMPRLRRRGIRRILVLSTAPRPVVPVESRVWRPELPRRPELRAGGRGCGWWPVSPPPAPVSSPRCSPRPRPPRPAACPCRPAAARRHPRPRSPAGCHRPPRRWPCQAATRRRGCGWWPVSAPRAPVPFPPASRPICAHPVRLLAVAVRLLPAGPLPPRPPPTAAERCARACAPRLAARPCRAAAARRLPLPLARGGLHPAGWLLAPSGPPAPSPAPVATPDWPSGAAPVPAAPPPGQLLAPGPLRCAARRRVDMFGELVSEAHRTRRTLHLSQSAHWQHVGPAPNVMPGTTPTADPHTVNRRGARVSSMFALQSLF